MAWRNSNRCIGRLFWETLIVQDARDVETNEDFIEAIDTHLKEATNRQNQILHYYFFSGSASHYL